MCGNERYHTTQSRGSRLRRNTQQLQVVDAYIEAVPARDTTFNSASLLACCLSYRRSCRFLPRIDLVFEQRLGHSQVLSVHIPGSLPQNILRKSGRGPWASSSRSLPRPSSLNRRAWRETSRLRPRSFARDTILGRYGRCGPLCAPPDMPAF